MDYKEIIECFIAHPESLLEKKPFTRGTENLRDDFSYRGKVEVGEMVKPVLPTYTRTVVTQSDFMRELDPACHKVLFDENIPSITAKTNDGSFYELEFKKMAVPFQRMIVNKHTLHLCGYGMQHTLDNDNPTTQQEADFALFKRMWKRNNQDGMRTKMVAAQKSYGDAALLYYFDRKGDIKSRLLSYEDGYVLCPHNDENGDRLIESVYYRVGDTEYIDSYTDTEQFRHEKVNGESNGEPSWKLVLRQKHGFQEIPIVSKRGDVAWNRVQSIIEVYEIIYNIFLVIQKRHGWGVLYIKGKFSEKAQKIAGNVVLNDSSLNGDGDAKMLAAPNPEGMLETLKLMEDTIQKGSGTTFILPKDITLSGDISGVAIQIAQSLDNEEALGSAVEWQNVASKMTRLFKYGLSKKLVREGDADAISRFDTLDISSTFKIWKPRNDYEYNQMLGQLVSQGIISNKTAVEKNTESSPDEALRLKAQKDEEKAEAAALEELSQEVAAEETTADTEE